MDGKHTKYPIFKGDNYSWWKHRMERYVKSTDYECCVIIQKGPLAITVTDSDGNSAVKSEESYVEADYRLAREFESEDIVRKILRSLSDKWQPKVTAIEEAKDLSKLSLNELMGSLMAHELNLAKRSGESSKARGFALKSTSSDEEDDGDDEQAMYSRNMADMINSHNPKKFNNTNKKSFQKKKSYSTVACFKCCEKGHLIKYCPKWNEFKSREKRDFAKKDFKHKVISAIWGVSDSDEDEVLEEELDAKVCMTTRLDLDGPKSSKKESALCLMAHSDDSSDDSDTEVMNLKNKVRTLSKDKLCLMFDDVLDKSLAKIDKLYDLQTQIEEIAEENVGLRECLDEIKESNIIPSLRKEIKKLRKENLVLTNIVSSSKSTVASTVVSDVEKENESLIIQVDILIKKRDSLLADLTSCRHDNKQLEEIAMLLSDECSHAKSAFDKVGKLNLDHLAKIETLTKELHDAKEFYRKWEGSQNILDSLINQSQKSEEKAGLGFQRTRNQFLSLEAYNGGTVTFGDNKKGEIISIGKVEDDEDDEDYELGMIRHDMDDVHEENEQEEQNQQSDQLLIEGTGQETGGTEPLEPQNEATTSRGNEGTLEQNEQTETNPQTQNEPEPTAVERIC
ncbi:uncharacterized protein LOC141655062 [Silene latifolia]|uniref:uncharacterized protein LOC141655062 n=1 Tax=Silene latifolia TaxID=37657 RepID=UPI003D77664B